MPYAPRTDLPDSGYDGNATARKNEDDTSYVAGLSGNIPPGMSKIFWEEINNSEAAEAIRSAKGWKSDADVRREIDAMIAQVWAGLPKKKRQAYLDQDAKGSKYGPDTPGGRAETTLDEAEQFGLDTEADFSEFETNQLAELEKVTQEAAAGNQAALDRLREIVNGIKDPAIKEYVGDFVSKAAEAGPSAQALANQQKEYERLSALTDPTITAKERLMMEMSRRQQEQDLRSQREAFANDLQARGMYGSGAELTMNLGASQEAAQRRAYEMMQAQANAQDRAFDALTQANEVAGNIRDAEADESQFRGTAADNAAKWNREFRDAYDKWRTEQERKHNEDTVKRESGLFSAEVQKNASALAGQKDLTGTVFDKLKTKHDAMKGVLALKAAGRDKLTNTDIFEEDADGLR